MATGIQTGMRRGSRSGLSRKPQGEKSTTAQVLKEKWSSLSRSARTGMAVGAILLSLVGAGVGAHGVSSRYTDLYQTQLSKQDLPAISLALNEMGIEHRVNETQDGILLHPKDKAQAQAGLTLRHLPLHRVELDDQEGSFSDTPARMRQRQQGLLEAEITMALRAIDGIDDARVKLSIPEKTSYFDKDRVVKARVLLSLQPGTAFGRERTAAIANLVSFSVPRLTTDQVTIVDTAGRNLTALHRVGEEIVAGDAEFEVRAREEQRLADKVRRELEMMFPGRTRLLVNLDLDFSELERRRYTPGDVEDRGMVEDSKQSIEEHYDRDKEDGEKGRSFDTTRVSVNYDFMKNYYAMVSRSARVERVTASVCLNGGSEAEAESLREVVAHALGMDESRGDSVYVDRTPWDSREILPAPVDPPLAVDAADSHLPSTNTLMGFLLAQLSLILVALGLFGWQRSRKPEFPSELEGTTHQGTTSIVDLRRFKNGDHTSGHDTSIQSTETLAGIVRQQPKEVASLLRTTWLS